MKKFYLLLGMLVSGAMAQAQTPCTTTVSTFPYLQNFESGAGGWVAGGTSSSWVLGTPAKTIINSAASGTNAWITGLTGTYNSSEQSYVEGPCFNLTTVTSPIFEMKIWWNSEFSWDGAVLQSSVDNGVTWQVVGAMGDPNNWYNDNSINGAPGGQTAATAVGWTGRNSTSNGSGGWVTAKHPLTGLGGNASVRLRIAFGADPSINDEGVAFDDVRVYQAPANDLEVTAITLPNSGCNLATSSNVCITVKNLGSAAASNIPVSYTINGGTPVPATMPGPLAPGATAQFCFPTPANFSAVGTYTVVGSTALAGDFDPTNNSKTGTVISVPSVSTFPYFQNFESGNGGWIADGTNSSWALGTPAKPVIIGAASGTKAWVTGLTGMYNSSENSYVVGPCFNLSSLIAPIFEMKIWWNSEFSWDGAVLQSSIDGGATWQKVGAMGDPNNWYNDNTINGAPGGQPAASAEGWTGRVSTSNGSNGWVTAKHVLTGLGGQSSVRLRIAFGSDPSINDDGFAFDDVRIFDTPANDAGVASIVSPTSPVIPNASVPVTVTVKNYGTANLTGATLGFSVNGVTVVNNVPFTGNLPLNQTSASVNLGNYSFPAGSYVVKAWTRLPNGLADGDPFNDTMRVNIISCNALTGTYTINKNAVASATNFPSFALAAQGLNSCGISGPVVFNVVNSTGPYVEQFTLSAVNGVSATNTVTFNGNGNILRGTSAAGSPTIKLDGADYIRFNNLIVETEGTATAGQVVHLTNGADNNNFTGCTIHHAGSLGSTSTSQAVYIYAGSNNNNKFENNIIIGGYYAFYNYGSSTAMHNANQFINNTIKDFYYYGIYNYYSTNTLIEGNDISRPTRTNGNFMYGIYLTTGSTGVVISKNRIHNTHDAATTTTGSVYGIYVGAAGTLGTETIIKNNAIYNINAAGGSLYGLYNSGGNNVYYFHNTVSADMTGVTYATLRGMYFLSASTNVKFQNNNISLSSTATGAKHALYLGSATISLISNGNNLYAPNGNVGYYTADVPTLTAWKAVNSSAYDQASASVDPQYVNLATGNLKPTNVAMNGIGVVTNPAVTTDILGLPRNATIPDPGAFEFDVNPNDVGVTAITGPVSGCGLTATQAITITVKNFGSVAQSNIPVNFLVNGTIIGTGTIAGPLAPNGTATLTFTNTANLSVAGPYTIVANTLLTGDSDPSNNTFTLNVTNALMAGLPTLNFETPANGINAMRILTNPKSGVSEGAAASRPLNGAPTTSTKGMIMEGTTATGWLMPVGLTDPWTNNPDHFSGAYICFDPAGAPAGTSLWLSFDLKQTFKTANANTNFRVTVNNTQVGPTYRPPFAGTPIDWQKIYVDLTSYAAAGGTIQIGLESSVAEPYANGAGTANLIDNIRIQRVNPSGVKNTELQNSISVYPNPSNGIFSVSVPASKAYTLEVSDLTGRVVKKEMIRNASTSQLNLNGQAQGVYLLKITSEGNTAIQKLIIE